MYCHVSATNPVSARLIGAIFLERGLVTEEQLQAALAVQVETKEHLGEILVQHFGVSRIELASVLAEQWADLERANAGATPPESEKPTLQIVPTTAEVSAAPAERGRAERRGRAETPAGRDLRRARPRHRCRARSCARDPEGRRREAGRDPRRPGEHHAPPACERARRAVDCSPQDPSAELHRGRPRPGGGRRSTRRRPLGRGRAAARGGLCARAARSRRGEHRRARALARGDHLGDRGPSEHHHGARVPSCRRADARRAVLTRGAPDARAGAVQPARGEGRERAHPGRRPHAQGRVGGRGRRGCEVEPRRRARVHVAALGRRRVQGSRPFRGHGSPTAARGARSERGGAGRRGQRLRDRRAPQRGQAARRRGEPARRWASRG